MLLSSSNRKYPPHPLLPYFSVVLCLRCLLHHILSLIAYTFRENRDFFSLLLCSLWWVQIVGYVLACRSYSFVCTVHHLIIIIVQTYRKILNLYNACQIYFVECVSEIKHILSDIHYTICGAVCSQFTHFSCDDWENIYTLCYYHHQIGSMNYYPFLGLGHETMVCAVCLSIFLYILTHCGMVRPLCRHGAWLPLFQVRACCV